MGAMRKVGIGVGVLVGLLVVGAGAFYGWAAWSAGARMNVTYDVHRVDFPIPFPLTDAELDALRAERLAAAPPRSAANRTAPPDPLAGIDLGALARERAVDRGKHLIESLYACGECHGAGFGGGVMVDDGMVGRILGPNLTLGTGSRTLTYTAADWDRIVRHGVKPDGKVASMPSKDFFAMSDRELSDIVTYIRSRPSVDKEVPAPTLGPLGHVLMATGQIEISATVHPTRHVIDHPPVPPDAAPDATYGKHIAQVCTGCHRTDFGGGPIAGGPPDWPPAANLTPTGLTGWTYEDFLGAMREGKSKSGTPLRDPMSNMGRFAGNMTDVELQAMWAYIKTLPAVPSRD